MWTVVASPDRCGRDVLRGLLVGCGSKRRENRKLFNDAVLGFLFWRAFDDSDALLMGLVVQGACCEFPSWVESIT